MELVPLWNMCPLLPSTLLVRNLYYNSIHLLYLKTFVFYFLFYIFNLFFVDPPSAPTKLQPSDVAKDALTLTWNEPDEDGGSPITGYWIERLDPDNDKWIRCNKLPIRDTTFRYEFINLVK